MDDNWVFLRCGEGGGLATGYFEKLEASDWGRVNFWCCTRGDIGPEGPSEEKACLPWAASSERQGRGPSVWGSARRAGWRPTLPDFSLRGGGMMNRIESSGFLIHGHVAICSAAWWESPHRLCLAMALDGRNCAALFRTCGGTRLSHPLSHPLSLSNPRWQKMGIRTRGAHMAAAVCKQQ